MSAATTRPSFYDAALTEAEREGLAAARSVEGLQDEIAVLRIRLREALAEHPEDAPLVERGVRLLIHSLLAEHRLSSREARGLTEAVTATFEEFANVLREAVE
jgi:hypothetical protein